MRSLPQRGIGKEPIASVRQRLGGHYRTFLVD